MSAPRRLVLSLAALTLAAAGLWAATRLVWLHVGYLSALRGPVVVDVRGADLEPALPGVAALAAAGVAAVVATGGTARRVVGVLLALAGAGAAWLSGRLWLASPDRAELMGLPGAPAGAEPAGAPSPTAAPALAVVAALVLVLAGVAVLRGARELPRLGARFDAPGAPPPPTDHDRVWWAALDAGEDPTRTSPAPDPRPDH